MADEASTQPAPRNTQKLLGLVFAVFNLAGLGVGAFLVYSSTLGVKHPETFEKEAKAEVEKFEKSLRGDSVLYAMEPISTNLDGVPRRLIRLEVNLEMLDQEGFEEVITKAPQARDSVMRLLNGKSYGDLESVQGKLQFKNEIITSLNSFLARGSVKNVYFTDLVVQ